MSTECGTSTCSTDTSGIGVPPSTGYGVCN
jgi:hypothetical protein